MIAQPTYPWRCETCGQDYEARLENTASWHSFVEHRCPNKCRSGDNYAQIETADEAWNLIHAFFRDVGGFGVNGFVSEDRLIPCLLTGNTLMSLDDFKKSNVYKSIETHVSPHGPRIRHMILKGAKDSERTGKLTIIEEHHVGNDEPIRHIGNLDALPAFLTTRLMSVVPREGHPKTELKTDFEAIQQNYDAICSMHKYVRTESDKLTALFEQTKDEIERRKANQQKELAQQEADRVERDRKRSREMLGNLAWSAGLILIVVLLVLLVRDLWQGREMVAEWLGTLEFSLPAVQTAWDNRPEALAVSIGWATIIIGVLLAIGLYIAVQVPLFYLIATIGLFLAFLVYKELWMLFSGLSTLTIGAFVYRYWLERERANKQWMREYYGLENEE